MSVFYVLSLRLTKRSKSKKTRIRDFFHFFIAVESGAENKGALLGRLRAKHGVYANLYSYKI